MSPKTEKIITILIALVFALALICDTVLELMGINVPGLFSLTLGVCALLFLPMVLLKKDRKVWEIVLIILSVLISFISGFYQIFA